MRQALTSSRGTAVPATVQAGSLAVAVPRRAAERALPPSARASSLDQLGRAGRLDWSRASLDSLSVRAKRGAA